jgi:putative lipoprotein
MSDEFLQNNRITGTAARLLIAIAVALSIAWAVGGCGTPAPEATATGTAPQATVTVAAPEATATGTAAEATVSGTVRYAQPAEPLQGTVVIVQIQDMTAAGAPVTVVGEQRISNPGPVPISFEVGYDPAAIDESHSYIVHARVEDGSGELLFTTMQNYAVITQGHPTQNVNVTLEMIGGGTAPL